jgi:hypothetical protein
LLQAGRTDGQIDDVDALLDDIDKTQAVAVFFVEGRLEQTAVEVEPVALYGDFLHFRHDGDILGG